ncbi:MAG TPA: ComEC/Rec2 family competence protein, partial [Bacteroidales bacterium]|nr:ComEC/Rec2 family competence protein [Bacteroidales bacterium]
LHVGMIWMVLEWLTLFLRRRRSSRVIRFLGITSILWFYAALTGLSPSVTRSCLMFSMVSLGRLLNRNSDTYNTVLVAAFIQLCIKPVLFFDAGFRFSYLAVLGILLFHHRLTSVIIVKKLVAEKVRDLAAVSLSAQFLTFPLGIYYFHQFPSWFLLTNFFVIPLVTGLVMIYLLSVICFFIPWASLITTKACILVAGIMNHGIGFIERLPGAMIDGQSINALQVCLFIVLPLAVLAWITYRKPALLIGAQCILIVIIATGIVRRSGQSVENALIVYNTRRLPSVSILSNGQHIVITDTSVAGYRKNVAYAGAGFWVNHFMENPAYHDLRTFDNSDRPVFRLPGNGNIIVLTPRYRLALISDCRVFSDWDTPKKFDVDFLVFTGPGIPLAEDALDLFTPGCVILSSAVPDWEAWRNSGRSNRIRVVDVRRSGCFLYMPMSNGM